MAQKSKEKPLNDKEIEKLVTLSRALPFKDPYASAIRKIEQGKDLSEAQLLFCREILTTIANL